jgi:hypothetical protein
VSQKSCDDCGGFDIEWMYRCAKHSTEYCRGCSCPLCTEESFDDYEEDGPMDLEDTLDAVMKDLP